MSEEPQEPIEESPDSTPSESLEIGDEEKLEDLMKEFEDTIDDENQPIEAPAEEAANETPIEEPNDDVLGEAQPEVPIEEAAGEGPAEEPVDEAVGETPPEEYTEEVEGPSEESVEAPIDESTELPNKLPMKMPKDEGVEQPEEPGSIDDAPSNNIEVYKKLMEKYKASDEPEDTSQPAEAEGNVAQDNCPVCGTELIEGPAETRNCAKCGFST
jgi:hypothetical protein